MKASEKHLIEFWIETGMVRRERRVPGDPASKDVHLFKHALVEDLELSVSWSDFFRMFNNVNHSAFLKELEGEIVENPFDPWRNPKMVGISFRIPPHNRQDYQLIKILTRGDEVKKEASDVESPVNLHEDSIIVTFTGGDADNNSDAS